MRLLAIAGGSFGDEAIFGCCGIYFALPLIIYLAVRAVLCNSDRSAVAAVGLAALPYMALLAIVADYQPSDDGDVKADQAAGRWALGFHGWLLAVAGLAAVTVLARRIFHGSRENAMSGIPRPPDENSP